MNHRDSRTPALAAVILLAAAAVLAAVLRTVQLQIVFDADGLPETGHPLTLVLSIFCAVATAAIGIFSLRLPARKTGVLKPDMASGILASAGGILLLFSCILEAADSLLSLHGSGRQLLTALTFLLCVLGMLSGLLIFAAAMQRQKGRKPSIALYIVPFLYIMLRLVLYFKSWSSDPIILDYCFGLFALLCIMGGSYRIGGYCFDQGKRRLSTFWAMTGVLFCAAAIPGSDMDELCFYCASLLWMLSIVRLLLRPGRPESETGD